MVKSKAERAFEEAFDEQAADIYRLERHIEAALADLRELRRGLVGRRPNKISVVLLDAAISNLQTQVDRD